MYLCGGEGLALATWLAVSPAERPGAGRTQWYVVPLARAFDF